MGKKDITLKDYFADRNRYADLLNGSLFNGQQIIKSEELQDTDTVQSKSDNHAILERINDIAMKQTNNGNTFAVWFIANQEKVDYSMPVRVMLQEALAYDRQLKEIKKRNQDHAKKQSAQKKDTGKCQIPVFADSGEFLSGIKKEDRLYPVVTLIVYWGEEIWQGAKSLHDILHFGEDKILSDAFKSLVPEYPLYFLNLSEVHDYQNFHSEIRTLFELYDRRNDKEKFHEYLKHDEHCKRIDAETAWALSVLLHTEKLGNETLQEEGGVLDMCKAINDLIADGITEGKAIGMAEGQSKGDASRIVKSAEEVMKNLQVNAARACEIIGVTLEEYQRAKDYDYAATGNFRCKH